MPELIKTYFLGFIAALLLLGSFIIFLSILYARRQTINRREKELIRAQFEQNLLQTQLEIQEQTLRYVGRELHDNLGQVATLIKINLNNLEIHDPPRTADKIASTQELTRQLITDIKSLSVSLGADHIAQRGLVLTLETEVERLNRTGQFAAVLIKEGIMPSLENEKMLILYRMCQEILNNMAKHSQATEITVFLHASDDLLTVTITDNGTGFDIQSAKEKGGAGLHNLGNRAAMIQSTFTMQSEPGRGSRFTIAVPI